MISGSNLHRGRHRQGGFEDHQGRTRDRRPRGARLQPRGWLGVGPVCGATRRAQGAGGHPRGWKDRAGHRQETSPRCSTTRSSARCAPPPSASGATGRIRQRRAQAASDSQRLEPAPHHPHAVEGHSRPMSAIMSGFGHHFFATAGVAGSPVWARFIQENTTTSPSSSFTACGEGRGPLPGATSAPQFSCIDRQPSRAEDRPGRLGMALVILPCGRRAPRRGSLEHTDIWITPRFRVDGQSLDDCLS